MKRNSTIVWACAAWMFIGLCGCSTSNPFKKKSGPTPPTGDLGYKPADTVPTPGTPMTVTGATTAGGSPAVANTTPGTQTYPTTGYPATPINATASHTPTKPVFNPQVPASAAKAGAAPTWTPPANTTAAAPTASQEGYYPTNYPGSAAPASGVAARTVSTPIDTTPAPNVNAANSNPFAAPTISGGNPDSRFGPPPADVRTADTRSGAGAAPWAARSEAAPTAGGPVAPWATDITPSEKTGAAAAPVGPEAWAAGAGSPTVGPEVNKPAGPRRDPHYRPGQTGDFQSNGQFPPSASQPPSRPAAGVVPAGFSSNTLDPSRRAEKPIAEATPLAPWGTAPLPVESENPPQFRGSNPAPWAQPDVGISFSTGGTNADVIRR